MRKIIAPCGLHCIKIKDLSVSFPDVDALEEVNLHIHCGSLTAVIGPNGGGKSTLFKAILGEVPHGGSIEFRNIEDGKITGMRAGYVPQSLPMDRDTPMDVYDLFCAFFYQRPMFLRSKKIREEVMEALAEFEADDLIDKPIATLSGGQLQRVLLSMALMEQPDLLLLDEPVSGIDQSGMEIFYEKMDYLKKNHDLAILVISHDLDYVEKYADDVVLLNHKILAEGKPKEVFSSDAFRDAFGLTAYESARARAKGREV